MRSNLNSLFFAAVVLLSVLFGGVRSASTDDFVAQSHEEKTSLVATVENTAPETAVTSPPKVTAIAALAKYLFNNDSLLSLNAEQQWPIASLTKLMTAVVAVEKIGWETQVPVSEAAMAIEGATGNLVAGRNYKLKDLLDVLLKVSSNKAALAIAEYYGPVKFLGAMHNKAKDLGMYDTRFFDPSGLSPLNQSTLSDLEKLVVYVYNYHPEIFAITREKDGSNIHPFAGNPDFLGGKTGFIDESGGNLISLFNIKGQPFLIIVLGSQDRAKDTETLWSFYRQSE